MIRSISSFIVGYFLFGTLIAVVWSIFGYNQGNLPPIEFHFVSIFFECGFALICGYLTALIAGRQEIMHAVFYAGFIALMAIFSLFLSNSNLPKWIYLKFVFFVTPCAVLGGYLRKRYKN